MLSNYIQQPFIKTPLGLATPALIISVLYLSVVSLFLYRENRKGFIKIDIIKPSGLMPGEINKLIISSTGYIIFILTCIFLRNFLEKEHFVITISKQYLQFEPLVFLLLFLSLLTASLNKINKDTHVKVCNTAFHCLIWMSIGASIVSAQIDHTYWKNILIISFAWVLNGLLYIIKITGTKATADNFSRFDLIPYGAVNSVDQLFPSHKAQAKDIANIICCSSSEPFSICLSGEWGSGKTSVINGVIDILAQNTEKAFDVIYINALELDSKKSMLNYLMTQIKDNLKLRGVYVGINSEYKEFIASSIGTLTSSSIGMLLQKMFSNGDDYRTQKLNLEKVLERTYGNGKLIVIVDDIERCDNKTAREYLFLIKEIATMRNCVSLFVTDFAMLNEIVANSKVETSTAFLDKFFNYKIDLIEEEPSGILNFFDKAFDNRDPAFDCFYKLVCKSPGTWYTDALGGLSGKLNKLEDENRRFHLSEENQAALEAKIEAHKECVALFHRLMQNPRSVAKFYNISRNHMLCCGTSLFSSTDITQVKKYIDSRNIGQVLYLISFIEVMLPAEYQQLKEQGPNFIDPFPGDFNAASNINRTLAVELTRGLIFGEYFDFEKPNGYIKTDIKKFIEQFLFKTSDLKQLVEPFTSQEEKWLNAINELDNQIIEEQWQEIVLMVLQKMPNKKPGIDDKWRNEKLLFLLEFAEKQVKEGAWTSDKLFCLFDSDSHIDRYWSLGKGLMQTFWKHLSESSVYMKPSDNVANQLNTFIPHYAYTRVSTIYKMAHYLIPLDQSGPKTENIQEYMLNSNSTFSQNILRFLHKFEAAIPEFSFSGEGWYSNYVELANAINNYLIKQGIAQYSDIIDDVANLFDSAEELKSLEHIVDWIGADRVNISKPTGFRVDLNGIDKMIDYYAEQFNLESAATMEQRDLEREFSKFFIKLRDTEGLSLTRSQLEKLHGLVEKAVDLFAISSLPYRRTLLSIKEKTD